MRSAVFILIYIFSFVGANLSFKKAAMFSSTSTQAWVWFALGNLIGFLAPISITLALKQGSASWFFAVASGAGLLALQFSLWFFYQEPLSGFQWAGIGLIVMGLIFINFGRVG